MRSWKHLNKSVFLFQDCYATNAHNDHNNADEHKNSEEDIAGRRDPERVPVQRRMTVGVVSRRLCEVAV